MIDATEFSGIGLLFPRTFVLASWGQRGFFIFRTARLGIIDWPGYSKYWLLQTGQELGPNRKKPGGGEATIPPASW